MAVSSIMMYMQKPMKKEEYEAIEAHKGELTCGYELVVTAYEKQSFLDAVVSAGIPWRLTAAGIRPTDLLRKSIYRKS